jgi:hypothetical protein
MDVRHMIFTMQVSPELYFHAYLMFTTDAQVKQTRERLITLIREKAGLPRIPIMLETELTQHPDDVEAILNALINEHPEIKDGLAKSTDYHLTMWAWKDDHPANVKLMELH